MGEQEPENAAESLKSTIPQHQNRSTSPCRGPDSPKLVERSNIGPHLSKVLIQESGGSWEWLGCSVIVVLKSKPPRNTNEPGQKYITNRRSVARSTIDDCIQNLEIFGSAAEPPQSSHSRDDKPTKWNATNLLRAFIHYFLISSVSSWVVHEFMLVICQCWL